MKRFYTICGNRFLLNLTMSFVFLILFDIATYAEQDLEIKISNRSDNNEYLQGVPISLAIWIVNNTAVRQWNNIQNKKSQGEEVSEILPIVKIGTHSWKWDDNLKIGFEKIIRTDGKVTSRYKKLTNVVWKDYYQFPNQVSESEIIGINPVRRIWLIPPGITSTLEPGEYQITVTYDYREINAPEIFHGLLVSEPLTIFVKEPLTNKEKAKVLVYKAGWVRDHETDGNDKATKLTEQALQLDPDCYDAHMSLAFSYWLKGELQNAITQFDIYLKYIETLPLPPVEDGEPERIRRFIEQIKKQIEKGN